MGRYIVGRSLQAIPVVVATSIVVFLILHLAPGDPVRMLASPTATEQDLANHPQQAWSRSTPANPVRAMDGVGASR